MAGSDISRESSVGQPAIEFDFRQLRVIAYDLNTA